MNRQTVYEPKPLFQDFSLADRALRNCVAQTIEDERVTEARQLTALHCSYAGIQSVKGLERFSNLQQVNLSYNELSDIQPLLKLTKLRWLDLRGNLDLRCEDVAVLAKTLPTDALQPPEHCASDA